MGFYRVQLYAIKVAAVIFGILFLVVIVSNLSPGVINRFDYVGYAIGIMALLSFFQRHRSRCERCWSWRTTKETVFFYASDGKYSTNNLQCDNCSSRFGFSQSEKV